MHVNVDKRNIKKDITNDHKELSEWVERIGKTANEICNDPDGNRIKLNEPQRGYIVESNDAGALGCVGWAIKQSK
jgi:hypothetical protein